jgi:hypothetical protein
VRRLYLDLATIESEALWEEFLKHMDDDRYSLTIGSGQGLATNWSVGNLCFQLACDRLLMAFYGDLPKQDEGRPLVPDLDIWEALAAWRKERETKSLYELQIEVCQLAIDKLMQEPDLSAAEKREVRKKIGRRIAALKEAKKPVFWKPSFDAYDWYDADEARRIREKARRESLRDGAHTRNKQPRRNVTSRCGGSGQPAWQRLFSPSP